MTTSSGPWYHAERWRTFKRPTRSALTPPTLLRRSWKAPRRSLSGIMGSASTSLIPVSVLTATPRTSIWRKKAICCCLCGLEGKIEVVDGKYKFVFPEETLPHAHDTISGKFIHGDDIQKNEKKLPCQLASPEMKERKKKVHGVHPAHQARA